MKVIVCGGRNYRDRNFVFEQLDMIHKDRNIDQVIQGGATGADSIAVSWANSRNVAWSTESANWKKHGKAAGPIRNKAMLDRGIDLVVAFPGGPGTKDMMKQARKAGVSVLECAP